MQYQKLQSKGAAGSRPVRPQMLIVSQKNKNMSAAASNPKPKIQNPKLPWLGPRPLRFHLLAELAEEIAAVVRAGGRFGMILDAEGGNVLVAEAGDGVVVEVAVGDFEARRERFFLDGKAVILGGNLDLAADDVQHRLVGPAMTEL